MYSSLLYTTYKILDVFRNSPENEMICFRKICLTVPVATVCPESAKGGREKYLTCALHI